MTPACERVVPVSCVQEYISQCDTANFQTKGNSQSNGKCVNCWESIKSIPLLTAYHPQTDGLVKRFNHTLINMLAKWVEHSGKGWDTQLLCLICLQRKCTRVYGWVPIDAWERPPFTNRAFDRSATHSTTEWPWYLQRWSCCSTSGGSPGSSGKSTNVPEDSIWSPSKSWGTSVHLYASC